MEWNPGDAVAAARRMRGKKSQQWLADRLTEITGDKWTRDMVANLENDRRTFDVPILLAVCEALDVPTGFILFDQEPTATQTKGVSLSSFSHSLAQPAVAF